MYNHSLMVTRLYTKESYAKHEILLKPLEK
jgi:hypothetical protein